MPVKRYSSGMQAKLGFSVAAHLNPDILLIDEVLAVGDAQFQRRCIENMKQKVQRGTAVIFISHNLPAVVDLCPRVLVLSSGEVVFEGPSGEGCSRYMDLLAEKRTSHEHTEIEITRVALD